MTPRLLAGLLWCVLLGWAAGILSFSSINGEDLPSALFALTFADKFIHFFAFALGGWLATAALRVSFPHLRLARALLIGIALVAAFGAIDETWQNFTPGRLGGNLYDWIADFLGAIAGALLTLRTHARLERFLTRP
ncbi:MAG: VanZ family protein [Verrucomicrobia bacterium]|nr:VanZ family protein [Verrucomicrobiota bacterium]MDA1203146.1 VanZ family protein [Verrucomicrobiota bacterium]